MPDTIDTPFWNDRLNGPGKQHRPLADAPVALADLGPAPMLEVPSTAGAMLLQLLDAGGHVVRGYDRVDANPPFRVSASDDKTFSVPPGPYTLVATPIGADGKPSGDVRRFAVRVAPDPTADLNARVYGVCFNDDDGDGVLDPADKPSGQRLVTLIGDGMRIGVSSNDKGEYAFNGLRSGTYRVGRDHYPDGFRASNKDADDDGFVPLTLAAGDARRVNIGTTASPREKPTAASGKLTGRMKIGLVGASKFPLAVSRAAIEPLKLATIGPWVNTQDFGQYDRDGDVAGAHAFAVALGVSVIWRCAQSGMTAERAKAGAVQWHLAHARDMIALADSHDSTRGTPVRVQVGNEPDNGTDYYADGMASWVHDYLLPVGRALRAEFNDRVELIAGGFSYDTDALESAAGELAGVYNAIAFHGYPLDPGDAQMRRYELAAGSAHRRGLRLIVSEGNLGYGKALRKLPTDDAGRSKLMTMWAGDVPAYAIGCESRGVDELLYFLAYDEGTTASPACLLREVKTDGHVTSVAPTPFYDALRSLVNA